MWLFTKMIQIFQKPSPPNPEFDQPWRTVNWSESRQNLLKKVNSFQPGNSEVETFRILLHGPVGAGKSSFINSVDTALRGRMTNRALADTTSGKSFTLECKTYKLIKDTPDTYYPFTFTDIMGIECTDGIQTDDIIKILQGHIQNDYTFNPIKPISEEDQNFNSNPSLKDKIHCLVSVLPADSISLIADDVIEQMREVRKKARSFGIPQVVLMTKVDEMCPLVKENLQNIYKSKKIKTMMETCSVRLGVPMSYIYPVKNYHQEDVGDQKIDILNLTSLLNVVNFASDYVHDSSNKSN